MKIFDNINNVITVSPEVLTIPQFAVIWNADKTKAKDNAYKAFTFIYHMCDYNSPYANFPEDKKSETVKQDCLGDKDYKPSKDIIDAVYKYKELQETPLQRLLKATKNKIDDIAEYLENTEINDDNVKNILDAFGKISTTVANFDKLQQAVEKEKDTSSNRVRGGKDINSDFNE